MALLRHNQRSFPRLLLATPAVAAFVAALVVSAGVSSAAVSNHNRLFAPNSVWNRPLEPTARIDPRSPQLIAGLVEEVRRERAAGTGPWIQTDSYSTPLYIVRRGLPRVRVALDNPTAPWRKSLQQAFQRVPIPRFARPAAGTDGHMTVWQPSTDTLWEFWQARKQSGTWRASWGGAIRNVSRSRGYYTPRSWPGLSETNWGATATSLPMIAGTMLGSDLRSPWIRHALAIDLPAPRAGVYSWPAQRTDGTGPPGSIPEGARLRLPPHLDLMKMNLPRLTLMMARAAKRRGIIVRDQTGHAIGFFAQDPVRAKIDPYYGPNGLFDGMLPSQILARFPWEKLRVLKMSLCRDPSRYCAKR